jgi:hypothetical protein
MTAVFDVFAGSQLREIFADEAKRLMTAGGKLYDVGVELIDQKAVSEGAIALGLYLKMSESLRHLLGLNAPQSHSIALAIRAEQKPMTFDRIAQVIERLAAEQPATPSDDKGEPGQRH